MSYNLFCKEKQKLDLIEILIILLLVLSFIVIILGFVEIFKITVTINLVLSAIKTVFEYKNTIKNSNEVVIDKPIVIDNENIYILQDKSGMLMGVFAICCILLFLTLRISGSMLNYFLIVVIIIMSEGSSLLRKANIKFLKNNKGNLYNIINSKNNKYSINKIEKITKDDNGAYTINFINQTSKKVTFTKEYENYDELIEILEQRCS